MATLTAVVVVTYNRKTLLEENIKALLAQTRQDFDVYIIDNASTDGTAQMLQPYLDYYSNLIYCNTGSNLGGAGGFCYGLNEVYQRDYQYCWIMDDDSIPTETAYESLCRKADFLKQDFSFLCSYVKWTDGSLCRMNVPGVNRELFSRFDLLPEHLLYVKTCSFVSAFVNLDVARPLGLPISEFFIYGDDYEYTLRLSTVKSGYWDFDSVVEHRTIANGGVDIVTESVERLQRQFYNVRNLTYVAKKYGKNGIPVCLLATVGAFFKVLAYAKDHKGKRLGVIVRGFFAGLTFHPEIKYKL